MIGIAALAALVANPAMATVRGLPLTRAYSLEEIGNVPRGARLNFDAFGRVAVISEGAYEVLNDTVWLNLVNGKGDVDVAMQNVVQGRDGRAYYGARGSWGTAELGSDGRLQAIPLTPADPPTWTLTAVFTDLIVTADGVYFASRTGVVYWDFAKRENQLFELSKVSKVFRVGNRVYISSFEQPLRYIDVGRHVVQTLAGTELDTNVVEHSTVLDETHSLVSFLDGRLAVFDGRSVSPWIGQSSNGLSGRVSVLQHLVDGGVAIGILGKGLFLLSPEGELRLGLTTSEYYHIIDIANHEPGVLWVATDDAIVKVLYDGSLTTFGQRLGVPLTWPIIASWNKRIFVASDDKLYEAVEGSAGEMNRFELMKDLPPGGVQALAAWGSRMLVGSATGVFSAERDGSFSRVTSVNDLAGLVMVDPEHCYAIGQGEIALLEWKNERWTESVARIPGVRNPSFVHRARNSVWIEMGGDGVARLSLQKGQLHLMIVPNASWTKTHWVNVGTVGDTVVLCGSSGQWRFFDEKTETWCNAPQLQRLLERSPRQIARVEKDEAGTIWATHNEGLVRFTPKDGDYEMNTSSFDLINDQYPILYVLPGNDVWLSTMNSLHHVEQVRGRETKRVFNPMLVSLMDMRGGAELLASQSSTPSSLRLPFAQNSLAFRFFSGGYGWRRPPIYEYKLSDREPWTALDAGSPLSLRGLHEGKYLLQVRIAESQGLPSIPKVFPFEILPPWYRTWLAYALFGLCALLALVGFTQWSGHLARKRNRALEQIVHERTRQLEETMGKLNDETRNTATLAERDRLAGEIHDSIQQGLSGAILQLDTTLMLPAMVGEVRSRLEVVRNMVSYTRQEVQNAVWDMESPLLEGTELGDALRKLTAIINSGPTAIEVLVAGSPTPLARLIKHNLLRIAQEAMTNAVNHAKARRIAVLLEYEPDSLSLAISDDGIGFCPEDVLQYKVGHFGLRGIRGRAKKLQGKLVIRSHRGQGTSIRVVVPLSSAKQISENAKISSVQ